MSSLFQNKMAFQHAVVYLNQLRDYLQEQKVPCTSVNNAFCGALKLWLGSDNDSRAPVLSIITPLDSGFVYFEMRPFNLPAMPKFFPDGQSRTFYAASSQETRERICAFYRDIQTELHAEDKAIRQIHTLFEYSYCTSMQAKRAKEPARWVDHHNSRLPLRSGSRSPSQWWR